MNHSQSYLKTTIDGVNGSGKSGTAVRLAIGISKELCDSAPVVAFDAEERYRFYKPTIFDVERVPLIIVPGKSLAVLLEAIELPGKEGACCFVGDQLTSPWMEGLKAFSYENGNLPFDRRQQLMNQWDQVVHHFRYGQFHAICCGRLGYRWENVENEDGELELKQGESKFNAGGGNNFGYEADLELEIRRRKRSVLGIFRGKTKVEHVCDVIKDATAGLLNGKQFIWPSSDGQYQLGDYKPVFESFRPYLDFMSEVPPPTPDRSSTKELIVGGKTAWAKDQSMRSSLLQELDANLDLCFGSKQSTQGKMFRNLTLEFLNGYISWGRMEDEAPSESLRRNVDVTKALRKRIESGEIPTEQNSLRTLLNLATEDVLHPGKHHTLLEAMGIASITSAKANGKPQGVVRVMDRPAVDEIAGA